MPVNEHYGSDRDGAAWLDVHGLRHYPLLPMDESIIGGRTAPITAAAVRLAVTPGAGTSRKPSPSPRLGERMGKTSSIAYARS